MAILIGTDQRLIMEDLKDQDGNLVSDATVVGVVYEYDGNTKVSGQNWPVTMSPVPGTPGMYEAVLDDGIDLVENQQYVVEVEANKGGVKLTLRSTEVAVYEDFS